MIRKLKILPQYFNDVLSGYKSFELRKDDRDYKVGDKLQLMEWDKEFTDRSCIRDVIYILRDVEKYGLKKGFVILGIRV